MYKRNSWNGPPLQLPAFGPRRFRPRDDGERSKVEILNKDLMRRYAQLCEMEESLPKKSGTYLKIILGSVNVSFLNKQDRSEVDGNTKSS